MNIKLLKKVETNVFLKAYNKCVNTILTILLKLTDLGQVCEIFVFANEIQNILLYYSRNLI